MMTAPGPMGYSARPEAMGRLISTLFADRLFEHGTPYVRVGLMTVYVEDRVAAELAGMERRPAAQALALALGIAAKVWDEAMVMHRMCQQTIDECQRQVRLDLEEILDEHIALLRRSMEAESVEPGRQAASAQARAGQDDRSFSVTSASSAIQVPQRCSPS
ncbi:hypothetical protein F8568_046160 [Actinomadura sp. LD22]|uniref:Uncharacterized protein n=1 Tax=Actinomadura physcomitrii TaxID=2650748 RepID=A0A6I4MP39_9ACTN|nr:hypothetical protein [Actinomadura physcomitrii]MWA07582.1 hypothetical protein [Actinomadura physcomitrii]